MRWTSAWLLAGLFVAGMAMGVTTTDDGILVAASIAPLADFAPQ
jgi:hypothetical protein